MPERMDWQALPDRIRAFIAMPVETRVQEALRVAQRAWARSLPAGAVRWTPPEQIHLTLKFLGDIPSRELASMEEALSPGIAGTSVLQLVATGFGCFPHERDPKVLWVGLTGDLAPLLKLQDRIEAAMSAWVPREERPFHAHLTLGRIKASSTANRQALREGMKQKAEGINSSWASDRVQLIRSELGSEGARYTVLRDWPLRREPGKPDEQVIT